MSVADQAVHTSGQSTGLAKVLAGWIELTLVATTCPGFLVAKHQRAQLFQQPGAHKQALASEKCPDAPGFLKIAGGH